MPQNDKEMLITKKGCDFCKWLFKHTGKFPKSHRFSIAAKLENHILNFIELTTVANMRRNKLPKQPGQQLEQQRFSRSARFAPNHARQFPRKLFQPDAAVLRNIFSLSQIFLACPQTFKHQTHGHQRQSIFLEEQVKKYPSTRYMDSKQNILPYIWH